MNFNQFIIVVALGISGIAVHGQELTRELAWAIKYGQTQYLDDWIPADKINSCLGTGKSKTYNPLAISIKLGSMTSMNYLLDRGADIEGICEEKSPLMYAAKYNRPEMLSLLIDNGADPRRSIRGKSALFYARKFNNYNIVRALRNRIE